MHDNKTSVQIRDRLSENSENKHLVISLVFSVILVSLGLVSLYLANYYYDVLVREGYHLWIPSADPSLYVRGSMSRAFALSQGPEARDWSFILVLGAVQGLFLLGIWRSRRIAGKIWCFAIPLWFGFCTLMTVIVKPTATILTIGGEHHIIQEGPGMVDNSHPIALCDLTSIWVHEQDVKSFHYVVQGATDNNIVPTADFLMINSAHEANTFVGELSAAYTQVCGKLLPTQLAE